MGEAKRRRLAREAVKYRDTETGEPAAFRWAGDPLAFNDEMNQMEADVNAGLRPVAKVPCNGCRECCWHHGVDVWPEEEPPENLARLDIVQRDGGWWLRKREDGACVHLGDAGCTVYQHRPWACRTYDCRRFALAGLIDAYDGGHQQPRWMFQPKDRQSATFLATWQTLAMLKAGEMSRKGDGGWAAADVTSAVAEDAKRFAETYDALATLSHLSIEEMTKMLGFDPRSVTAEQYRTAVEKISGRVPHVLQRDKTRG